MSFMIHFEGSTRPYLGGEIRSIHSNASTQPVEQVIPAVTISSSLQTRVSGEYQKSADQKKADRHPVIRARDIMSSPVLTVLSTDLSSKLLTIFKQQRFRHIPVLNSTSQLVGIISDRDLLEQLDGSLPVSSIMSKQVLTTNPDTPIQEVVKTMLDERIDCIPLMEQGRIVGIITRGDILRAVMRNAPIELWT
jgi:CBS-domain-containing membrane protein